MRGIPHSTLDMVPSLFYAGPRHIAFPSDFVTFPNYCELSLLNISITAFLPSITPKSLHFRPISKCPAQLALLPPVLPARPLRPPRLVTTEASSSTSRLATRVGLASCRTAQPMNVKRLVASTRPTRPTLSTPALRQPTPLTERMDSRTRQTDMNKRVGVVLVSRCW